MRRSVPTLVAAARLKATAARPYYAAALFALEPTERGHGDDGPLAVDGAGRLWWSDDALGEPVDVLAGRIVHGLEHLLREHGDRGRSWTPVIGTEAWAAACDCEIGDDLDDLALPADFAGPTALGMPEGKLAEWYASRLAADRRATADDAGTGEQGDGPAGGGDSGAGDGNAPAGDDGGGSVDGDDGAADSDDGHPEQGRPAGRPEGRERPHECLAAAAGPDAPAPVSPGLSEARLHQLRTEVAGAVASHRGTVPSGVARWAADHRKRSRVDWRSALLRTVRRTQRRQVGGAVHDARRPSRRSPYPVLLPRIRGLQAHPAVVVDTSASMDADALATAVAQIEHLLRSVSCGEPVDVITCDAAVHGVERVARAGALRLAGGGGSDMAPGIETAARRGADVVIVLTDGWVNWPDAPTRTPVIAGLIGAHCPADLVPAWVHTVEIDEPEGCRP